MLWLAYYNLEMHWRTEEVKIMRYLKEYRKQWRLEQKKPKYKSKKRKNFKKDNEYKEDNKGMGDLE